MAFINRTAIFLLIIRRNDCRNVKISWKKEVALTNDENVIMIFGLIFRYIWGGAILFSEWEDWNMLDGSYFCFVSLSTIGFGDIVPGDKIYAAQGLDLSFIFCSMYLMLGECPADHVSFIHPDVRRFQFPPQKSSISIFNSFPVLNKHASCPFGFQESGSCPLFVLENRLQAQRFPFQFLFSKISTKPYFLLLSFSISPRGRNTRLTWPINEN